MHKVTAKDFGLRCVSNFASPKPYDEAFIAAFVSTALHEFAGYGIGAQSFGKSEGDRLFGYWVSISIFNGNATFVLNRDALITSLFNGQSQEDAELIKELLSKAHRCLPELEKITHVMTAFCHAEFADDSSVEKVLRGLLVTNGRVKPVGVSVLSEDSAEAVLSANERLRLDIAPSELKENRLFMSSQFTVRGAVSEEYWTALSPRLKALAGSIGIELVN